LLNGRPRMSPPQMSSTFPFIIQRSTANALKSHIIPFIRIRRFRTTLDYLSRHVLLATFISQHITNSSHLTIHPEFVFGPNCRLDFRGLSRVCSHLLSTT
jgi:hypothetical protein